MAFSPVARANDTQAETLYQEGRRAAQAKDWATACKKFKESHDREPAPGTLLNLADCEEHRAKLVDALDHFESAARLFPAGNERALYATERASALGKRIPRLTVRLASSATPGTTVECDGAAVDAARLGTAMPVDPGEHVVVVRAPGRADVRSTLKLAEGEARQIEIDAGGALASPGQPPASGVRRAGGTEEEPRANPSSSPLRTAGFVSLGVSAVGLGVGLVGGLMTLNAKSTADANCGPTGCRPEGLDAQSRGKTWSAVSTVGFATAGAGLLVGVGLLVLSPSSRAPVGFLSARPVAGGSEVSFAGSF
jgi:hypothetical protein